MEPKELRIGNFTQRKSDKSIVIVTGNVIHSLEYGNDLEILQPIPLTEEWLLSFGFEKIASNYDLISGSFPLWHNHTFNVLQFRYYNKAVHVEYVHQLQNLYFALMLDELKKN